MTDRIAALRPFTSATAWSRSEAASAALMPSAAAQHWRCSLVNFDEVRVRFIQSIH
jgi:hypothetical protein